MSPENSFDQDTGYQILNLLKDVHRRTYPPNDYFPTDAPENETTSVVPTSTEGLAVIHRRTLESIEFRHHVVRQFEVEFPRFPLHLQALKITDQLATDINQIFAAQMEHANQPLPRSWNDDAPLAVNSLIANMDRIYLQYQDFFRQCPENYQALELIAKHLAFAKDPEQFSAIASQLEALLLLGSARGIPVITSLPADSYTLHNDNSLKLKLAEANVRLLFPFTGNDIETFRQLVNDQTRQLNRLFNIIPGNNVKKIALVPEFAYGLVIPGFCSGDQGVWSTTPGEALIHQRGILYSPLLGRSLHLIRYSFQLAGISGDRKDFVNALTPIYVAHELAHPYYGGQSGMLPNEASADIPMIIVNLISNLRSISQQPQLVSQVPWENHIAALVGECATMATMEPSNNDDLDGYIISARYLTNLLIKHRLISISPNDTGYIISPIHRSLIRDLVKEALPTLQFIYADGPTVNVRLRQLDTEFPDQKHDFNRLTKFFADFTS